MRAPPAQAPPRFSRTGTRGQEPVAGAFAGDRYPGRVPKGAACEVTLLRAARAASPRTSFMISISSPPRASAAALALPLSRADAHLVAVHAAAAAAAAAAAPTDDACGNVHARPRHCTRCVRRHGARHSLFRSPLPLARTRRRSLACSLSRAPRKSDVSPLACARRHLARRRFDLPLTLSLTRAARHARVRVRHHRASRASSPFSVPPAHDRHARAAAAAALARSLARAEAEAVGLGVALSYTAHHARHARHARARARHHRASRASSPFLFPHAPTRARCDGGGARSLDSARDVWRLRWRWRAVEVAGGYIARHARYARRSSRACTRTSSLRIARVITVFRLPAHDRHARAAAAAALARSLARAEAEAVGWGWRSVTPRVTRDTRVTRVTRAREHVITAHRARHHRSSSPHAPTRARCDGSGARSLDSARGVWRLRWRRWRAVEVAGGYIARHARYVRRASRACTITSSPRIARVITVFRPPAHDRHARAAAAAALARSLARAEAEAVGLGVAFSYTARHARHARARARHHRASRASSPPPFPDVTHAHARQRRRRCLVCSLARARGGGGGRSFARRACLARHARARARHPRHGTC